MRSAPSIAELLQLQRLGVTDVNDQKLIADHVLQHPEVLCLVLDGQLEETDLEQCGDFVQGVIRGEELRGVRLVLTFRHSNQIDRQAASHPRLTNTWKF